MIKFNFGSHISLYLYIIPFWKMPTRFKQVQGILIGNPPTAPGEVTPPGNTMVYPYMACRDEHDDIRTGNQ